MAGGPRLRLDDPAIPPRPGVYLVYCDVPLGPLDWDPTSGPAYVGKADTGLSGRITVTKIHLGDSGRPTLRRTYGALLKDDLGLRAIPRLSKGPPKEINFTNYTFAEPEDSQLTAWMMEHLRVTPIRSADRGVRNRN